MNSAPQITRANPSCFLFLIDQSTSMGDPFADGSGNKSKAQELADAINRMLLTLVTRCTRGEEVRDYFDIGLCGYRADQAESALLGDLAGRELVPISELALKPLRLEDRVRKVPDGAGGLVNESFRLPVWLEPVHSGGTPMCRAFSKAHAILSAWVSSHPQSYPPTLMHISDGESTDGDPSSGGSMAQALSTTGGPVAVFNLHLSSQAGDAVIFPDSADRLVDAFAVTLFNMSSVLPEKLRAEAQAEGYRVTPQSRAFAFNAELTDALNFLDIGTRTSVAR